MARFRYTAKNRDGTTSAGYVEADTLSAAASMVREMGCFPLRIEAEGSAPESGERNEQRPLAQSLLNTVLPMAGSSQQMLFFRQMGVLLASGMTLSEALASILRRQRGRIARVLAEMYTAVSSGEALSSAMDRRREVFSDLQISLVRVGESTGSLQRVFEQIASYLEREAALRNRITRALFYPFVLLGVFACWQVVMGLIESGRDGALGALRGLIVGQLIPILVIVLLARFIFQFRAPKAAWDFVKIQIPWLGTVALKITMSRFCRAFALLHSSGVAIGYALDVAADACGNVIIGSRIRSAIPAVNSGQGVTESLQNTRALTPVVLEMLAAGEKTGVFDTVLEKAADYLDQEVEATMYKAAILATVIALLLVAIRIGMAVISFYTGALNSTLHLAD